MSSSYSQLESPTYANRTTPPISEYSEDFESNCCSKTPSPHDYVTPPIKYLGKYPRASRTAIKSAAIRRRKVRFQQIGNRPDVRATTLPCANNSGIASELLYAKQQKMNELQDELAVTQKRYQKLRRENRIMKTLQQKQEKAIRNFENKESELPRLISEHAQEQRVLRFRLKVALSEERKLELRMRETNNAMLKMEDVLCRLKTLVKEKNLGERSELARKLADKNRDLATAEERIEKLHRQVELCTCSFMRQIDVEKRRHKETMRKLEQTEEACVATKAKLGEKVRALNDANVYAFRMKVRTKPKTKVAATSAPSLEFMPKESPPPASKISSGSLEGTSEITLESTNSPILPGSDKPLPLEITPPALTASPDQLSEPVSESSDLTATQISSVQPEISAKCEAHRLSSSPSRSTTEKTRKTASPHPLIEDISVLSTFITAKFNPPAVSDCSIPRCNSFNAKTDTGCTKNSENIFTRCKTSDAASCYLRTDSRTLSKVLSNTHALKQSGDSKKHDSVPAPSPIQEALKSSEVLKTGDHDEESFWREPDDFRIETRPKKSYQFSKEIQNLHLGIPSSIEGCKKRLDNLEKQVMYFGSYSPTFGGSPTRRKYLQAREYKSVSTVNTAEKKPTVKGTNKADLLMKLFKNLEIEKNKLLGDESGVHTVSRSTAFENRAVFSADTNRVQSQLDHPKNARKSYKNKRNSSLDNGDNLDAPVKPQFHKELAFLDEDIEERPD